ncbi:hypothetical protein ACSTB0_13460, partial [Faecalibacterium wellingii]
GFGKRLRLLVGLGGQAVQPFLLPLNFELGDGQVFFGAAALAAMTEALGREVYHYHLHVVYVPVVEKQILWSKRCKDKALVGTV